jgi:hypothetical protein
MAFTGPVEDRLAIRELYDSFGDGSCRGDREAWLDCWAESAQWKSPYFDLVGKNAIRDQWDQLWVNFEKVALLCNIGAIEVVGDSASTRCVVREIVSLKGGGIYKLAGRYEDHLVRENGQWCFARREYFGIAEEM